MKKRLLTFAGVLLLGLSIVSPLAHAQDGAAPATQQSAPAATDHSSTVAKADAAQAETNTKAAAALASRRARPPRAPDFLEHLVDEILAAFDVRHSGNTVAHFSIAAVFLLAALLLRHIVTGWVFGILKRLASRTQTTFDDKLFPALEPPIATFIALVGIFAALAVLKLSERSDLAINYGQTIAFSLVIFWGLLRAFGALLDHAQEISLRRNMGVAAFMPWIKKSLITLFVVVGGLMVVQSLGYDVKALLAGLGIGGLAFALAAQDTLANVFGSIVVAIDQPFKIGEFVQIGANAGAVEDIGVRSTKLRRADKALVVVPNKTVAAEAVLNFSRFTGRRADQVLSFTYGSNPEQLAGLVEDIRALLKSEPEIDPASVLVFFRDFNTSSLDVWLAYNSKGPDFVQHMNLRQRLNLQYMRMAAARGLSFALPTQRVEFQGDIAQKLADRPLGPSPSQPNSA
jgi:MscS family membrane protein